MERWLDYHTCRNSGGVVTVGDITLSAIPLLTTAVNFGLGM